MAQGPGCLGKSGPIFNLSLLLRDLLFFTSGGYKSGKIFIPKMRK